MLIIALSVFCIYGFVNYVQKTNTYFSLLTKAFNSYDYANVNMMSFVERFRISSFAWHAIYYGLLLLIGVLLCTFMIYNTKLKAKTKISYQILIALLLINLLMVNSRTPIVCLTIGISIYFMFGLSGKKKVQFVAISIILLFGWIVIKPNSAKIIWQSINIASDQKAEFEDGSSIEMRSKQLQSSLSVFNKNPITGNGIYYIIDNLKYSPDQIRDEDFFGFESYIFELLIEQGICGIIGNLIFFTSLFLFFFKNVKKPLNAGRNIAIFSISLLAAFSVFIIATGELGSFTFFFSIMGINMKATGLYNDKAYLNSI